MPSYCSGTPPRYRGTSIVLCTKTVGGMLKNNEFVFFQDTNLLFTCMVEGFDKRGGTVRHGEARSTVARKARTGPSVDHSEKRDASMSQQEKRRCRTAHQRHTNYVHQPHTKYIHTKYIHTHTKYMHRAKRARRGGLLLFSPFGLPERLHQERNRRPFSTYCEKQYTTHKALTDEKAAPSLCNFPNPVQLQQELRLLTRF